MVAVALNVTPAMALTRAQVVASLAGFEREPAVDTVRAWGPDGALQLMDVANDPGALAHVRVRAVHALRAFPGMAPVQTFLRVVAARASEGLFLRRASFDALVEGFGDVTEVSRYLSDPAADVRDGAAWALSLAASPSRPGFAATPSTALVARAALAARLSTETDATVRTTLRTAIQAVAR